MDSKLATARHLSPDTADRSLGEALGQVGREHSYDLSLQRGPCQGACVFVHARLLCSAAHATAACAAVV